MGDIDLHSTLPHVHRYTSVDGLNKKLEELELQIDSLKREYRQAGHELQRQVADDLVFIHDAREEAQLVATVLQGSELFGRYAQDSDRHGRIANRWRFGAVSVLIAAAPIILTLAATLSLGAAALTAATAPLIVLFLYASLESNNHRRREFDRRRIALRLSAIETFTKQRREAGDAQSRRTAERLLDEFVRKHFIQPDLDSNDMTHLGPRFSLVTVLERQQRVGDPSRPFRSKQPAPERTDP